MAWWSKVRGVIEKHDTKLGAAIRLKFACNLSGVPLSEMGLYRRDPTKHPGEPDVLGPMMDEMDRKKIEADLRAILNKKRKPKR